jgi:mono/diheme cytochrome c family protein
MHARIFKEEVGTRINAASSNPISIMIRYFPAMLLMTVLFLAASANAATLPPGKGKAIVQRTCISCHALKVVTAKRASKEQWSVLIDQMISRGADLNDDEVEIIVNYLVKNFGTTKAPANTKENHHQTGPVTGITPPPPNPRLND